MKLRIHNMLTILPVFLGTVLIIGVSKYLSEREEMIWGAKNEIAAFAISLAEFVDPTILPDLTGAEETAPESVRHLLISLDRVFSTGFLRHLAIYTGDGERILYAMGDEPVHSPEALMYRNLEKLRSIAAGEIQTGDNDGYVVISPFQERFEEDEPDTIFALAPVSDGRGTLAAIVFIEKDVTEITQRMKAIITQMAIFGIVVLFIGMFTIAIISSLITKPIQRLTEALLSCIDGRRKRQIEGEYIGEFQDLGNSYNTMVSVLDEAESRINRDLVQSEHYFSGHDLACAFRDVFRQPIECERGSLSAVGATFGSASKDFFDISVRNDGAWAVVCRLSGSYGEYYDFITDEEGLQAVVVRPSECDIDVALSASCVSLLMEKELARGEPQLAYDNAADLFEIEFFHYVFFDGDSDRYTSWILDREKKQLIKSQQTIDRGSSIVLHTFSGEASERITVYSRFFGGLNPQKLMDEILRALGDEGNGTLVVIKTGNDTPNS